MESDGCAVSLNIEEKKAKDHFLIRICGKYTTDKEQRRQIKD